MAGGTALRLLKNLSRELTEIDLGSHIDEVDGAIDPLVFLREYVAPNKPLIIRGGVRHWPAMEKWTRDYMEGLAGEIEISVDVTPNGRGDAVTPYGVDADGTPLRCFCTPQQRRMTLSGFLDLFFTTKQQQGQQQDDGSNSESSLVEVPYLQHQNSNLTVELPMLLDDVEHQLPWASRAFGSQPDAVNLWIGDERAATTFHKDAYENIYCMVHGVKVFYLLPPCDAYRMALTSLPLASFQPDSQGRLVPVLEGEGEGAQHVTWSPVDPQPPDLDDARRRFPLFFDPTLPPPLMAEVGPGDILYLPSLWYHYVAQRPSPGDGDWVVAVNHWYDMHYGTHWAHFKLAEALATEAGLLPRPQAGSCASGDDASISDEGTRDS